MSLLVLVWQAWCRCRLIVSVEVLRISLILHLWYPWRRNLPLQYHLPVDTSKPFVIFYLVGSADRAAHSQTTVSAQEAPDKITSFGLNVRREFVVAVHNLLINAERIIVIEWRIASEHLENEYSKCPPVNIFIMTFALDNLWCQILWGSA